MSISAAMVFQTVSRAMKNNRPPINRRIVVRQLYTLGKPIGGEVWVVYKNPSRIEFQSSDVVVVSKRSARVLDEGPAGDEG